MVKALREADWDLETGLAAYQASRKPILDKLVAAARSSCDWYEKFADHMRLEAWAFALSYVQRGGRLDASRLRSLAPLFTQELQSRGIDLEAEA